MSLGTSLVLDVYTAIKPTETGTVFPTAFATAVNNYLGGAVYADGALTYASSVTSAMFTIPAVGTAASAAAIIGLGVMSYWTASGVVPGVAGVATTEALVLSGTITASTVGPAVTAAITTIFSDLAGGQYWVKEEVADHTSIVDGAGDDQKFLTYYDDFPSVVVMNTTDNKWYRRASNAWVEVTDTKWHQIAGAIVSAVEGVATAWVEVTPPSGPVPFTGSIA